MFTIEFVLIWLFILTIIIDFINRFDNTGNSRKKKNVERKIQKNTVICKKAELTNS